MKITNQWLKEQNACKEGVEWFLNQKETAGLKVVSKLLKQDRFGWSNWLIVRLMTHKQQIQYAVFAAEKVLSIYEKKYPGDKRHRQAIEAAKAVIQDPSEGNKRAANAAAYD